MTLRRGSVWRSGESGLLKLKTDRFFSFYYKRRIAFAMEVKEQNTSVSHNAGISMSFRGFTGDSGELAWPWCRISGGKSGAGI